MKTSWQVATAAEAFCAAQFARFGWDVSVQYGANQPEYDMVVVDGDRLFKISVKGSQDGGWGLTQALLKQAKYHEAADRWCRKHSKKTALCLVQFKGCPEDALPRMYLAAPAEISAQLQKSAGGRGDTILYEHHKWTVKAAGAGTTDSIPSEWRFTRQRIDQIFAGFERAG